MFDYNSIESFVTFLEDPNKPIAMTRQNIQNLYYYGDLHFEEIKVIPNIKIINNIDQSKPYYSNFSFTKGHLSTYSDFRIFDAIKIYRITDFIFVYLYSHYDKVPQEWFSELNTVGYALYG